MRSNRRRAKGGDAEPGKTIQAPLKTDLDQTLQLAFEEYKIIQSKIDNIGDFSQRVRGWSLTICAGIVAAAATKELPAWFALAGIFTTLFFKLGDDYQKRLQSVLIRRALRIEEQFEEAMPSWAHSRCESFPYLANTIRDDSMEERRSRYVWPLGLSRKTLKKRFMHDWRKLVWRSEAHFYLAQAMFATIAWLVLWKGKPSPASYQADVTAVLRGITNTAAWKGSPQTNILVIQSAPALATSVSISSLPSNGLGTIVFPGVVTNFVFSVSPSTTNYVGVLLLGPLTNFVVFTNGPSWPAVPPGQINK